MRILKFGGTSLKNAERFLIVASIIEEKAKIEQISIVLSAPEKITDYLTKSILEKYTNITNINYLDKIKSILNTILYYICEQQKTFPYKQLKTFVTKELLTISKLLEKINTKKKCPDKIKAIIISKGEIFSIAIMEGILQSRKHHTSIINPVKKLIAIGSNYLDSDVNIEQSSKIIQKMHIPKNHIILMPGFIAGNYNKELTLLGRNGSDYSAAILSACLNAVCCEIWTDVDGIYTCDPKIILKPYLLKYISYQEALKLSCFGAKILHPKTIRPILDYNIPCIIQNTLNLQSKGTIISNKTDTNFHVKGITYIDKITLIKLICIQNVNIIQIVTHIYNLFLKNEIKPILSIQSSFQKEITICIYKKNLNKITNLLQKEFKHEIEKQYIQPLHIINNLSIISIITSDIYNSKNTISKIFKTLYLLNIKIFTISQENCENVLSFIVKTKNTKQTIKIAHSIIYHNTQTIELFIIGIGNVGRTLLKQIQTQKNTLYLKSIKIKVCGIANSKLILINSNGICLKNWFKNLNKFGIPFQDLHIITNIVKKNFLINPVIVDCTSSIKIAYEYSNFIKNGLHIVTPNKKANTNSIEYYKKIRQYSLQYNKKFLYETNVGSGLPIIENLQKLINSGDQIIKFKGILSGSLSFIFGKLDEGLSLSEATLQAQTLGFTEPNPQDDLSGIDVARKLLILAREMGFQIHLKDIVIDPILTHTFNTKNNDTKTFFKNLSTVNNIFNARLKNAQKLGKVLRFVGTIENKGQCKVTIENIDLNDPLYTVKNGENALIFYTKYYNPLPLVLRGYGAGNEVTAAGIFSDILRII
ncbi:homoserine dehydrogenase [Buchnera aphidicola (Nipponaphis monzeni)]|uniref:Bifunctional aspartokinase/homoserine dehydrogenase n=1 Tax=Buchnera aphidicola (Nipponaphis monzeni) TaxID=2495405 RepID=A0A455TA18_9GAMM|nr:bifunctional aspartate kinase/homoserine dehydrogenase I [Buchnera aphidicola]BBI01174.1 homoserine dehydrogenase [Buchnera aphidicola (Nipponaphis monzeni)]